MSNNNNEAEGMEVDENENENENKQETESEKEERALKYKADGNKKYSSRQYKDAIELYTKAINTYKRPEFYGNRAAAYIAIHDFEPALNDCLSAINLDPKFRKAYIRGTKCYTEMAQFDEAKKFAQSGLEHFPNDKEIKQGYDRISILQNKLDRINTKLNNVSLKYDSFFESHLNAATKKSNNSDLKEEKNDDNKNNHYNKIIHKLDKNDLKEIDIAISMINSLINNDLSQSLELKCTNVRALIIKQNYDGALSSATNLLRWNKDSINVTKLRAIALFRTGNTDSAIKHLQSVLRKDPDNKTCKSLFKLFKSIGRCKEAGNKAFKSSDLDTAITKYTECLLLDRTNLKFNSVIYANRAAVWLKKKEWQNAYDDCTSSIELNDQYIKSYCRRVQALYGLERYDEAVGDAENALKLDPSSHELKQQLRQSKIELKKSKRKNYYKILGVEKTATEKEIKKGFRKKAMVWHPDKFASGTEEEKKKAEEKFKEIGEAYEVLKDPKMKQRYDAGADLSEIKQGSHGFGMGGGVDISHIFDLLGGMGGGGMGGMPHGFSSGGHGHGGHGHGGHGHGGQQFTFRFG